MDRPAFIKANGISMRFQLSGAGTRKLVLLHEMSSTLAFLAEVELQLPREIDKGCGLRHVLSSHRPFFGVLAWSDFATFA
jgi:hypothetical protein